MPFAAFVVEGAGDSSGDSLWGGLAARRCREFLCRLGEGWLREDGGGQEARTTAMILGTCVVSEDGRSKDPGMEVARGLV